MIPSHNLDNISFNKKGKVTFQSSIQMIMAKVNMVQTVTVKNLTHVVLLDF